MVKIIKVTRPNPPVHTASLWEALSSDFLNLSEKSWSCCWFLFKKSYQEESVSQVSLSSRANTSVFKNCDFNLEDRKLREIHNAREFSKKTKTKKQYKSAHIRQFT